MVGFNCTFAQSSGKQVKFQKLSILKYRTSTHLFNYGRYTMYNVQSEPEINGMNVVILLQKMSLSLVICKCFFEQYSRNSNITKQRTRISLFLGSHCIRLKHLEILFTTKRTLFTLISCQSEKVCIYVPICIYEPIYLCIYVPMSL